MVKKRKKTRPVLRLLTHPGLVAYLLPMLMAVLIAGTLSQRFIGLYESERIFFSSFILWAGIVPLPGAYMLLGALSLGLLAKILFASPWKKEQAGIIITHMGALLLLLGGLLTALTTEGGYVLLKPGEPAASASDYHRRELAMFRNGELVLQAPFGKLREGMTLSPLPFDLRVRTLCRNCGKAKWKEAEPRHGLAREFALAPMEPEQEDEENHAGAVLEVSGAGAADGVYLTFESAPRPTEILHGSDTYRMEMRREQHELPFSVRLEKFTKATHPGTAMAQSYASEVTVSDGKLAFPFTIRMNHPLRYQGYTLYQASFVTTGEGDRSVLASVKNHGRVFPYVASLMMCAGLITHLLVRRKK